MYYKSVSAIAGGGKTAVLLNTFSKGLARCSGSNWVFFPDPNWLCAPGANTAASLLPYSTIEAAASGNVDAINAVLKHYERYIAALATRTLYDENGVPHLCLDEEKVCRMRTKLITKILDFKVNKTA